MEIILACISPSPSNPKILRAAADMATDGTELIALFVETPQFSRMSNTDRRRLQENIQTAERLGAKIRTVSGDDVAFQVAEYGKSYWDRAISIRRYCLLIQACRTGWRSIFRMRRSM